MMMHQSAMIPSDDRGLAYGDGVFETVLVQNGQPSLWQWHCARLMRGCRRLGFEPPNQAALDSLMMGIPTDGCYVFKLIVTRGSGGRGYCPPAEPVPQIVQRLMPFTPQPERWQQGIDVRVCELTMSCQPRLAGIKHLNRLENVLARQEWQTPRIAEGLLCNARSEVIEATAMNVAWYAKGHWYTPHTHECGVMGTLSAALMDAGTLLPSTLALTSLPAVQHVCVFNSVQGVWPIRQVVDAHGMPLSSHDIHSASVRAFQQQAHTLLGYTCDDAVLF